MNEIELLNWARGPGLAYATIFMVFGLTLRVFEILSLGRPKELAEVRENGVADGWKMIFKRSLPEPKNWKFITASYVFHVGLLVVIFFFIPHTQFFRDVFGVFWGGWPSYIIDFFTVLSIAALLYTMVQRLRDPARRIMTTMSDYLAWLVTFLPFVTGYMAFHRLGTDYTLMLALHILSVELLMIALPISKLTHAVTFAMSRYYLGSNNGRRGIQS
jgi:nitrate reductase gamma subunit